MLHRTKRMLFRLTTITLVAVLTGSAGAQANARPAALSAFSKRKAESLLRDHLPCLGCHKLNGEGGTIGPDLTTVRERRSPEYIASMIADPQRVVPGGLMPRIRMAASTQELITRYLGGSLSSELSAPRSERADTPVGAPSPDPGPLLYARWCASCHGASGKGDGPNASNLPVKPAVHSSREAMSVRPDDSLFDTIASGGAVMNRSPRMPAFGGTLTAAEIRALVRHIRALCRCEGPAWSRNP